MNDKYETVALKRALGEDAYRHPDQLHEVADRPHARRIGAIEAVACVQAIRTGDAAPDDQPGVPGSGL